MFPLQTDEAFSQAYNKWGCYAHCIAKLAWDLKGWDSFNLRQNIVRVVERAISDGLLSNSMWVKSPNRLFLSYGLKVVYSDRHERPERVCGSDEIEILFFKTDSGLKHFVVGDGKGGVQWDPYGDSKTVREGQLDSKRIFKVLGRL